MSAIRDANRVIGLLHASNIPEPKLIINPIKPVMVREGNMMAASDVLKMLAVDAIGLAPSDDRVITATNNGTPVVCDSSSPSGREFVRIAARIDGDHIPLIDPVEEPAKSIMDKVRNLMGITRERRLMFDRFFANIGRRRNTPRQVARERVQSAIGRGRMEVAIPELSILRDRMLSTINE